MGDKKIVGIIESSLTSRFHGTYAWHCWEMFILSKIKLKFRSKFRGGSCWLLCPIDTNIFPSRYISHVEVCQIEQSVLIFEEPAMWCDKSRQRVI